MSAQKKKKTFFKNKNIIIAAIIIIAVFAGGIYLGQSSSQKSTQTPKQTLIEKLTTSTKYPPSPANEKIVGYIQSELADIDKDKTKELIAIYHSGGDEFGLYLPHLAIFKLENNAWNKIIEQELEGYTVLDKSEPPENLGKYMNQLEIADLNNDANNDVLVKTRAGGSGGFLGVFIFGIQNGKVEKLFVHGPIPKGEVGIENNKIWIMEPIYGPDDPNCCPSAWTKTWWQWQESEFEELGEITETDFETLKKTKYQPQAKIENGIIEGSLSYPSEGIPSDMTVCAENLRTQKHYCTNKHLQDSKYMYGIGYQLEVPEGSYHIFASTSALSAYKAYYTEAVPCGLSVECQSHDPVSVNVYANQTISNIDPQDWYR